MTKRFAERRFTLLELLIVIAVIAILLAILLPSLGRAKAHAVGVACVNRLRNLGVLVNTYQLDYNEWIPPTCGHPATEGDPDSPQIGRKWYAALQDAGYFREAAASGYYKERRNTVAVFSCPALKRVETRGTLNSDFEDQIDYGCSATQVYTDNTLYRSDFIRLGKMKRPELQIYAGDCWQNLKMERGFYSMWLLKNGMAPAASDGTWGRPAGRHNGTANFICFAGNAYSAYLDDPKNPQESAPFKPGLAERTLRCTNKDL